MKKDLRDREFERRPFKWADGTTSEVGVRLLTGRKYAAYVSAHAPSIAPRMVDPTKVPEAEIKAEIEGQRLAEAIVRDCIVDPDDNAPMFDEQTVTFLTDNELTTLFSFVLERGKMGKEVADAAAAFRS